MNVDTTTGEIRNESIMRTLRELRQGGAVADLSDALVELVTAVRCTGSKGVLTLTLTVSPAAKGEVNALLLEDAVKLKLPRSSKGATILFSDQDGVLSRKDPRQPELLGLVQATVTRMVPTGTGGGAGVEEK